MFGFVECRIDYVKFDVGRMFYISVDDEFFGFVLFRLFVCFEWIW